MKRRLGKMEKANIEKRAAKVLNAFGYKDGKDIYVDSVRLARFFGFEVEEKDSLPAVEDGSITVSADCEEKNIVVNNVRSIEFKRFIIIHELAHYLLHYTGEEKMFMHRENTKGKSLEENDADYLAACILMPAKSFKKQYDLLKQEYGRGEIIMALQRRFCTPAESIERRIDEVCR